MPSLDHHTSPHAGTSYTRWIAIAAVVGAIAVGVVLLVLYGGGGSGSGY